MANRNSRGVHAHKPGCSCRACSRKGKFNPTGQGLKNDGAMFAMGTLSLDEGDYIGRRNAQSAGNPVYVDTSRPAPPLLKAPPDRVCLRCGAFLSMYNWGTECQSHKGGS